MHTKSEGGFATSSGYGQSGESLGTSMADKAKDAATFVGEQAECATSAVGSTMESLGQAIRSHQPAQGMLHNAGEAVASRLDSGSRYLEQHGLAGIGDDITEMIRRNPIPALLIGVGIGAVLARMVRR